jgi:AraC-like DNA-binding protein
MEFLEKYRVFQTTDHDAGQDFASRVWEKHHSLLKGKQFDLTWNQADLKRASLAFVDHPCGVVATCDGPLSDTFRILFHQSGRMEHRINGKESVSFPGQCTVHPPQCNLRLDIEPFSLLLLSLDGKFVRSALNQRFSKLPSFEEWATSFSMSSPSIATLNSLCLWVAKELENPQSPLLTQNRAAASFERTLLTLFVEALVERHPSAVEIRGDLSELHVKRAEEWIDAHLEEAIGAEEAAAALGVEAQTLVQTFKRVRGYSPAHLLLRRRLERAREILGAAGPDTTVTDVATGLGFFELGRFATRYRERFGERPSETLARSLGRAPGQTATMQKPRPAELESA